MPMLRPLFCPGPYSDTWSIKCHASLLQFCSIECKAVIALATLNETFKCLVYVWYGIPHVAGGIPIHGAGINYIIIIKFLVQ